MLPYSSSGKPVPPALNYQQPATPPRHTLIWVLGTILGLIVLAGAVFAAYYIYFRKPVPNLTLQVSKPDQVLLGEPFRVTVAYTNESDQNLEEAAIVVTAPDGASIMGLHPTARLGQQDVGLLGPQQIGAKTFDFIVTEGEDSVKQISISFKYRLEGGGPGPGLEKTATADIAVGAPAIVLNFSVPQKIFAGQMFDMDIAYQNNSKTPFQNTNLIIDYPQVFQFQSASSSPTSENHIWGLGTLEPGTQGGITVTGSVGASQQTYLTMATHMQVELNGQRYDLASKTAPIGIQSTPLAISIVANRKSNYIAALGETIFYTLNYRNNSEFSLQNIVIEAALDGEMFDLTTLRSPGSLDSVRNTVTWNAGTAPALRNLAPRQSGSVDFSINLKGIWPIQAADDKNFSVQVSSTIQSLSVPPGITAEQTLSSGNTITKISGQTTVNTSVYYKEPAASSSTISSSTVSTTVVNTGPYPPKVNQPTQYTVHWKIVNYSTDAKNVRVMATLLSGARMLKVVRSNAETSPVFDSRTGQVSWDIPIIPAGQGVLGEPLEAVFQIEATPAANQSGRSIPLIGETTLKATDGFTGVNLTSKSAARDSSLPDDAAAFGGDRRVLP
ncbi:MAG: hypothetical protein A2855_01165 [Candidatus Liptonbacteria bacterium RIFCSPHIGHO2_01_FULL_57_28]|uniref:DUF11 domain-containing protein n=1 Tax=Candidatus Liptonbacteria bacterium RIFCSPHIGHO2_01_FULL_57_28 TaxID=1798647 RepID=A0A1G2CC04_9BACT|nr:MAG: hypothetical protein A2855_01165 [Candidatus Liptonbacteria bacterium RIFCSPHIGHO2_01_FULL_57_28]